MGFRIVMGGMASLELIETLYEIYNSSQSPSQEWGVFKCSQWSGRKGNHSIFLKWVIEKIKIWQNIFFFLNQALQLKLYCHWTLASHVQFNASTLTFTITKLLLKQHGFQELLTILCLLLMQQHRNKAANTGAWGGNTGGVTQGHITGTGNGDRKTLSLHAQIKPANWRHNTAK